MTDLGRAIHREIRKKGLTITQIGERVGLTRTAVYAALNRPSMDVDLLRRLSLQLDCDFFLVASRLYYHKQQG